MRSWIQRISYEQEVASPLLFTHNYLAIGFSEINPFDVLEKSLNNDWKGFENEFQNAWDYIPRQRFNLWNFVHEMKKGDWVLVPAPGSFSVFEIINNQAEIASDIIIPELKDWQDNPIYASRDDGHLHKRNETQDLVDLGFFRKVKPLFSDISRDAYADQALTSRLKTRNSNIEITDLERSLKDAIASYKINKPINLHNIILEQNTPIVFESITNQLNPDKFEKLIKWYFTRNMATSVDIPAKNENGKTGDADIIATFDNLKLIIYVQAKFHRGLTSSWAIEQIQSYKDQKESLDDGYSRICWVISTADQFDEDAIEMAKLNYVNLINGMEFSKMLIESGIQSLGNAI